MTEYEPDPIGVRLGRYRRRDYIHEVNTFADAEEVLKSQEIFFLRDQNRALIKLVGVLKAENRRLRKRLDKQ